MSSNHLSTLPEVAEALAWLRQTGWPTSEQDIALGTQICAQIQCEELSGEPATCVLLTRLIAQLSRSGAGEEEVLYRAILVRLIWKLGERTAPSIDGVRNDA